MGTDEDAGVYRSERRRVQRRKKIAVGVTGLAAVLAGGGWAVSAWHTAQDSLITGDLGALAPAVIPTSAPPSASPPGSLSAAPSPLPSPTRSAGRSASPSPRLSGARQSSRPSPTPSASPMPDDEVASAQVSSLLQVSPPPGGAAAAAGTIVVTTEAGADGSAVRVLSARRDLGRRLWAADGGRQVGDSRCTNNLRVDGRPAQVRPGVLVCWRVSAAKSVVTVATRGGEGPVAEASARVLDRTWRQLG
jgi:hypothetical protein